MPAGFGICLVPGCAFYDGDHPVGDASGGAILAAQALGADLAYIGTRFIASQEANAPAEYKQMIIASRAEDIVYTNSSPACMATT
jgi:nitronate monooxygenase